jgi:creatinine amidohydrolase
MRHILAGFCLAVIAASAFAGAQAPGKPPASSGISLAEISWKEAETALTDSTVVVIPLGVAAVEHGPHLKLNNNERLARYLAARVQAASSVVIAPTLTYHFYPSFLEYPGSTSLSANTARDMTVDIVRSLSKSGPRRFYVLNTGRPTVTPLSEAARTLADDGILLGYTDARYRLAGADVALQQLPIGVAHADEVATSMMLFVDPSAVDMKKAVREYASGTGALTRKKDTPGVFSESGVLGDATVATREKGQRLVDALLGGILQDIESIRQASLPIARTAPPPPPAPAPRPAAERASAQRLASGCTAGDERAIRAIGEKFQLHWRNQDVPLLMTLFAKDADMRHPDGTIERPAETIAINRVELFKRREYRGSVHTVTLNDIRCLGPDIAIADGKWELRMETSPMSTTSGRASSAGTQIFAGWCTLVLRNPGWSIEAWRYTVTPQTGPPPPTVLKQPGFLGRGGGGL